VVYIYDQKKPNSNRKPAEEINWARLLRGRCIVAGNMNVHGRVWNARAGPPLGETRFWEGMVEDFGCTIWNFEEETGGGSARTTIRILISRSPRAELNSTGSSPGASTIRGLAIQPSSGKSYEWEGRRRWKPPRGGT